MNIFLKYFFCILLVFVPIANTVFAISYFDSLGTDIRFESVSGQHISEASLLQSYIERYQDKINNTYAHYSQNVSFTILEVNKTLRDMSLTLKKIQEEPVNPNEVEDVMTLIVEDLKTLNRRIKIYFQRLRDLRDDSLLQKQQQYEKIATRISVVLDTLIKGQTARLIKITHLSKSDKKLVESLVKIQEQNNRIKNFSENRFKNEQQIKEYLKNIIINIRAEILILKKYL